MSTTYYRARANHCWRPLGVEAVLLDIQRGEYFSLNEVGAVIWRVLQETSSLEMIVERVKADFLVDADLACEQVRDFLKDLLDQGMIEVVTPLAEE